APGRSISALRLRDRRRRHVAVDRLALPLAEGATRLARGGALGVGSRLLLGRESPARLPRLDPEMDELGTRDTEVALHGRARSLEELRGGGLRRALRQRLLTLDHARLPILPEGNREAHDLGFEVGERVAHPLDYDRRLLAENLSGPGQEGIELELDTGGDG